MNVLKLLRVLNDNPLEAWTQRHFDEPVVATRLPFLNAVLVSDPNAIKRVLLDNAANYRRGDLPKRMLSTAFRDGLLITEGEKWRRQRHAAAGLFALKSVHGFAPAMREVAEACISRWSDGAEPQIVDVGAEMTRVTLEVLAQTTFASGVGGRIDGFRTAMRSYFDTIGKIDPCDLLGLPDFVPRISQWRARHALRFFENAIAAMIAARRAAPPSNADSPPDLLSALLAADGLSDAEIRSNLITLIAAGHETTAATLTWSHFLLSQSPQWSARVAAEATRELDGPAAGLYDRLVETRAVIDEALRLYPPIVAVTRVAEAADQLAGHEIEPGTTVVVAPYVLHRHRGLWDRPDEFDPDRFLGERRRRIGRFAYLPFGAGPHVCLGAGFALQEAAIVLATVWRNFDLQLKPGHAVTPLLRITLRPRGGLPMLIRARRAAERGGPHSAVSPKLRLPTHVVPA